MSIKEKLSEFDKTKANKILFALVFVLSCLTMNSNRLKGYNGTYSKPFTIAKFVLIIIFVAFATYINKSNIKFISKFVKYTLWIITPIVCFDYYVTHISGSQFLISVWWIGYILMAAITVFVTLTILKPDEYKGFYYDFWIGLTPIYVFILIICFLRTPGDEFTSNFRPGNGTFQLLKAIFRNPDIDSEIYIIFIGNIVIFLPLAFILSALFRKLKPYQLAIIGFLEPFIVEGYQLIFKCGDVDIDDVILNWLGFFIGLILQHIIKKRLLKNE